MAGLRLGYSLKALGGRLGEQWERDRRDTLLLLGATLLSALPHFAYVPWWTTVGFLMLFVWRLGLVLSGRWLPRDSVRWVAAIACIAAVYAEYHTLFGREPGVAILLLFLGLKLLEMRARRDLFVVLFICFFVLLATYFHSQSLLMAASSLVAVVALLVTLLTMQSGTAEAGWNDRLKTVGILLAQALPLAALVFVLFPRISEPLWQLPKDAAAARTGLSDTMTPGAISELAASQEVAFRVQFLGPQPPSPSLYWRGPVMELFDGNTWRGSGNPGSDPAALAADGLPIPARKPPRIDVRANDPTIAYQVTLEPNERHSLLVLEAPARVEAPAELGTRLTADMQVLSHRAIDQRIRYRAESHLRYRFGIDEPRERLDAMTRLPAQGNPRTRALAQRWQAEGGSPEQWSERALRMFREQSFRYTMTPPLLGADGADDFLFDTRAGFCEHFSSAYVILMRMLGVPARVVTGYQGGETNPVDGYWIVRQADAHAWAEIWLENRGWVRVDPTAAVAPERIEHGSRALSRRDADSLLGEWSSYGRKLAFNLDALTNAWNQWVLNYDRSRQRNLLARFGLSMDDLMQLAGAFAAGLALLIGAVALLTLHPRLPKDPIERSYLEFCDRLAAAGLARAPHETASRHLERIAPGLSAQRRLQARTIVSLYNNLRYGADAIDRHRVQHLRTLIKVFKP